MREIILDTETTGLNPAAGHRVIEIGCVEVFNKVKTGKVLHFHLNPERDVPDEAFRIHGLSTDFLKDKPLFKDVADQFVEFISDSLLVIHNAPFDIRFLNSELKSINYDLILMDRVIDTLTISRKKFPGAQVSLGALCKRFKISNAHRTKHGALLDSELLYDVYIALTEGIQSELKLHDEVQITARDKQERASIPYRSFSASEAELNRHKEFLKKIKSPLWESTN